MIKEKLVPFFRDALAEYSDETGASGEPEVFLVDVLLKGSGSAGKIEVLAETDAGISIARCMSVNRWLRDAIGRSAEIRDLVGDDCELTVSSPGIGEPIQHERQYIRHTGRLLRVQYAGEDNVVKEVTGRLERTEMTGTDVPFIVLEPSGKGRNRRQGTGTRLSLNLDRIKKAVVEIEF